MTINQEAYEKETGKKAVWHGKITQGYKEWEDLKSSPRGSTEEKKEKVLIIKTNVRCNGTSYKEGYKLLRFNPDYQILKDFC